MIDLPAIGDTVRIERGAYAGTVGTCVYSSVCSPMARHGENVVEVSFSVIGLFASELMTNALLLLLVVLFAMFIFGGW